MQTNCLSEQLQEGGISIVRAVDLITTTKANLVKMRSDSEYNKLYDEANEFARKLGVDVPEVNTGKVGSACSKRVQQISNRLKDYLSNSTLGKRTEQLECATKVSLKQQLKSQLYFPLIDRCNAEYDRRFSNNINLFQSLSTFDVHSEQFFDEEKFTMFSKHYSTHIDSVILVSQVHSARALLKQKKPDDLFDVYSILNILPTAFSEILSILRILLTIPVTTAGNERFFSVLKRVKNYLRTRTGDDRLCSLMLMAIENKMVKSFDLEELVDDFAHLKPRRYPLL